MKIGLHTIALTVTGTINQTIQLNDDSLMTKDELIEKISDGRIVTTVGHGTNRGQVYLIENTSMKEIGKVVEQDAQDDVEIYISEYADDFDDFDA